MQTQKKQLLLTRLKEFKNFFERRIRERGEILYEDGHVQEVKYSYSADVIVAEVQASFSGKTYEVYLNIPNLFRSNCTCPYEWGFCKHVVAVTLFLIRELQERPQQTISITQENTVVDIPVLNKSWIKKNTPESISEDVDILAETAGFEVETPESGRFKVKIRVNGNTIPVEFTAKKGSFQVVTKCNCRGDRFVLCKHKLAALWALKARYKTTVFDTCLDWSEEEQQLAGKYGATPEMVKQKKAPLEFVFRERQLEIKSKSAKLVSNSLFHMIPEPGKRIHSEPELARQHHDAELIYVLSFSYLQSGVASFTVHLYKGFYTKDGSRIKSTGFTEIYDPLSDDLFLQKATESDYKILQNGKMLPGLFRRLMQLPIEDMPEYDVLTASFSVLQPLFSLLSDRMLYLHYNGLYHYGDIRLKNCTPVQMSKETIKPVITQKAAKDYSTLHIAYYINGEQVEPEPKKGSHYWFFRKGNTLHPWQNSAALFLYEISGYEALDRIDFLDFQREKVFERFIRFFQDKIEVTIEDPEIKPLEEADSEKQVYLQEHGEHILFFPVMLYGSSEVNLLHGTSDGLLYERRESETVQIKRDKEAEDEALQAIRETIPQFEYQQDHDYFFLTIKQMLEDNRFIKFYEKCRANHIRVFGFKELKSLKYHPAGASVSYSIKSNEDWFDMELSVSFDDHQVSLKDLRKAVVNHENLVPIGDGQYGILPDEFLKKFSSALKVGEIEEDNVKLQKSQFTVVHALLNQQSDVRIVEELSEKMQMLKSFDKIESVPVPQNLKATMRDYQKAGLSWLAFLARFNFGGCLADDMGLGKTVQMLAFFLHLKEKDGRKNPTHLVVCPTTLIFNWQNEIKKFAPSLKTFVYWGTQRQFDEKEMKKHDVVLTSYGTMVNDIELLHKFRFTTAVFDESQAMKNPSSLRFKAALLLQAQYRFSLTGTPIENNTIELFSQMHVLNKGLLGTFNTFRKTYGKNLEGDENAHLRQELRRIIYPFIIRRTKEKVAAELPEKSEIELYCEMGEHQQKVYEAFRQNYKEKLLKKIDEEGVNKARFNVLDGILKLRQICDSPALLNTKEYYGDDSAKADELIRYILEKTSNHKVLVFSQFVKMLTLIKNRLEKHNIVYTSLDGATRDREERVNYFQNNEECRVFLISLKAGGYGLNLTAADYVFLIDPWWNPAVESQAIDRTHRIGQAKKVFAYRMISKGTIEEKILKLQKRKKSLADEIITEESSFVKKLTAKDIEHLFS